MWRGVMLPKLAYRSGFPPTTRFRSWRTSGHELAIVLLHIISHGSSGALKGKASGQLLADEGVIKRFALRQELSQELLNLLGPKRFVVAAGSCKAKSLLTRKPLAAQSVKARSSNLQSLGGGLPVHVATVEKLQDFGNQFRTDSVGELFFIATKLSVGGS